MKNSTILKMLPLLTEDQLKQTRAVIDRLLHQNAAEDANAKTCLDVINEALSLRVPYSAVKQPWKVNADNMAYFIDRNFPRVRKVVRVALFKICIGMVIDHLRSRDAPVTFGTVWVDLVRVPDLFDAQFPGYRETGLCNLIVKTLSK